MTQSLTAAELDALIQQLEIKQQAQWFELKVAFSQASIQFQPLNIVKNSLHELAAESKLPEGVLQGILGFGADYLSNLLFKESGHTKFKHLLIGVLQAEITPQEKKQADTISLFSKIAFNIISKLGQKKTSA